jgi:hypothetical protein
MIFRVAAAILTGLSLSVIAVHYFAVKPAAAKVSLRPIRFDLHTLKTLAYLAAIFSAAALVLTGFYAVIVTGRALTGYLLMLHVTAAGVFAASLAVSALFLAQSNSFAACSGLHTLSPKICFWLMLALSLPVMLSGVLSMFSLFGTNWQAVLYYLHRYSTILFTNAAMWYAYLTVCSQKEN